jgi:hypothetical protein|tara:strand:+ start:123 stop:887 length:765 start_codon:yes stop_codon:yes gene_type:complete
MPSLKTINTTDYNILSTKIADDENAKADASDKHIIVCRDVYTLIGGVLNDAGFPANGKSLGKRLTYKNLVGIFGAHEVPGNTVYNARRAYGKANGEPTLDGEGNDTGNSPIRRNCRKYISRIKKTISEQVDPQMVWPTPPKATKQDKRNKAAERKREAKMATDPEFAAKQKAIFEKAAQIDAAVTEYETSLATLLVKLDDIKAQQKDKLKGKRSQLPDDTPTVLASWTKALDGCAGVIDGRLTTRAKTKRQPRK